MSNTAHVQLAAEVNWQCCHAVSELFYYNPEFPKPREFVCLGF